MMHSRIGTLVLVVLVMAVIDNGSYAADGFAVSERDKRDDLAVPIEKGLRSK